MRALLVHGAAIGKDHLRRGGRYPSHLAAMYDHVAVLELLVAAGADVDARDRSGATLLTTAAAQGNAATVEYLLKENADPDLRNATNHETPLHAACRQGHHPVVKILVRDVLSRSSSKNLDPAVDALTATIDDGAFYTRPAQLAKARGHLDCARTIDAVVQDCLKSMYSENYAALAANGYKSKRATSLLHEFQCVSTKPENNRPEPNYPPKDDIPWRETSSYDPSMNVHKLIFAKCSKCDPTAKDKFGVKLNTTHTTVQHHAWMATAKAQKIAAKKKRPASQQRRR